MQGMQGMISRPRKSKTVHLVSNDTVTTQRDIMSEPQVANYPLHPLQHVVEAQIVESIGAGDRSDRSPAASPASPASSTPGAEVDAGDQPPASPASPAARDKTGAEDSHTPAAETGPTAPIVEEVVGRACQVCQLERGIVIDVEVTDASHVFDARSFLNPNLANICNLYGVTIPDVRDEWVNVPSGRLILAETQPDQKLGRRVRTFRPLPTPADL